MATGFAANARTRKPINYFNKQLVGINRHKVPPIYTTNMAVGSAYFRERRKKIYRERQK